MRLMQTYCQRNPAAVTVFRRGYSARQAMEASTLTHASRAGLLGRRSPLLKLASDEKLVAMIRSGHEHAFEALFDRYHSRLLAFCRHMLRSTEDAEDVLQEVFVKAHAAMLADERPINARPWLYRIARNRSLNHLRRPVPEGQDSMDIMVGEGGVTTADRVQGREDFRSLVADVKDLPETQRTALLLREIDALSYEEIAQTMDTTVPAVKSLLVRARMSLAEASQSRQLTCGEVRLELAEAAEGLCKASGPVRQHVKRCEPCHEFRGQLRSNTKSLAALAPLGPLALLHKLIVGKLGGSGSAAGGTAAGTGGVAGGSAVAGTGARSRRSGRRRGRSRGGRRGRRRVRRRRGDRRRRRRRGRGRNRRSARRQGRGHRGHGRAADRRRGRSARDLFGQARRRWARPCRRGLRTARARQRRDRRRRRDQASDPPRHRHGERQRHGHPRRRAERERWAAGRAGSRAAGRGAERARRAAGAPDHRSASRRASSGPPPVARARQAPAPATAAPARPRSRSPSRPRSLRSPSPLHRRPPSSAPPVEVEPAPAVDSSPPPPPRRARAAARAAPGLARSALRPRRLERQPSAPDRPPRGALERERPARGLHPLGDRGEADVALGRAPPRGGPAPSRCPSSATSSSSA